MSNGHIRVGIAGLGRSGWDIHAPLLQRLTDSYHIVAVTDPDPARRAEAVDRFQCTAHESYAQLLADPAVELVIVAVPSYLHTAYSLDALAAGKHVVCEKPMALALADADRMVAAAAQADSVLTVFQQRRYNPDFVKVRAVIESGLLGRIVEIRMSGSKFSRRWDWQTLQEYGGGTLNNTGAHFLDMALQLFGPSEPQVFCRLDRTLTLGDAEDHLKIILQADDAPTIDVEISSCDAYPPPAWHVLGTQGGLTGTRKRLDWRWITPDELPERTLSTEPTPDRSYNRDDITWYTASWQLEGSASDAHVDFYRDLCRTLREGAPLVITPESVRRVIWLQDLCHRLSPLEQTSF